MNIVYVGRSTNAGKESPPWEGCTHITLATQGKDDRFPRWAGDRPVATPEHLEIVETPSASQSNRLVKLAHFAGIEGRLCGIDALMTCRSSDTVTRRAVALSAQTLDHALGASKEKSVFLQSLRASCEHLYLYVYGFNPENVGRVLACLAGLPLTDAPRVHLRGLRDQALRYDVSLDCPEQTQELTGMTFTSDGRMGDAVFDGLPAIPEARTLVTINGHPSVIRIENEHVTCFLHATEQILDLDEATEETELRHRFSYFVPQLMFMRATFGDRCWRAPQTCANFIIDDPYLRPRYGFVEMRQLAESAERVGYAVSIAFIPWNHKRTSRQTRALFNEADSRLSICVHGCDHTDAEFGGEDAARLRRLARSAAERMAAHETRTGIPCERVMVFPQGVFSAEAMAALKAEHFVAAANSRLYCTETGGPQLRFRDILDVAVMSYASLPLFSRRYPAQDMAEFYLDAFLNKPLLAVEHHAFFRPGFGPIESFVRRIATTSPRLKWTGLSAALMGSYVEKRGRDGCRLCRLYCRKTTLANGESRRQSYRVFRREDDPGSIECVRVNGEPVAFRQDQEDLLFELEVEGHGQAQIEIVYRQTQGQTQAAHAGLAYGLRVWLRRVLSEFRDNTLCRNDAVLALAKTLKQRIMNRRVATRRQ